MKISWNYATDGKFLSGTPSCTLWGNGFIDRFDNEASKPEPGAGRHRTLAVFSLSFTKPALLATDAAYQH